MRLLYITQKLHDQDTFIVHWVRQFVAQGYDVHVICLEWQPDRIRLDDFDAATPGFTVTSLGKESGATKLQSIMRFYKTVLSTPHDRVFLHLNIIWGLFGAPYWLLRRTPVYAWYTHYVMKPSLWITAMYAKRLFCATRQSLPQYDGNPKKIVTGHGIDLSFWHRRDNICSEPKRLLMVHRLSESKRIELSLQAMALLPAEYTLDIYGIEAEPQYAARMKELTKQLGLSDRVTFHGTIALTELPSLYASRRFLLNMASETIDKTMVEAMTCGCYPVTTKGNAEAIGIPLAPADSGESIAAFIQGHLQSVELDQLDLYAIVEERHSLSALISRINEYIKAGC